MCIWLPWIRKNSKCIANYGFQRLSSLIQLFVLVLSRIKEHEARNSTFVLRQFVIFSHFVIEMCKFSEWTALLREILLNHYGRNFHISSKNLEAIFTSKSARIWYRYKKKTNYNHKMWLFLPYSIDQSICCHYSHFVNIGRFMTL